MAAEVVVIIGAITSAVTGAVVDRAVSKVVDNLGNQTLVADKLQRLERLLMRIRSTVEVSEKHDIESAALLQWREKLREAVALGDEVLLSFQQPAAMVADAAQDSSRRQAMSFTRNALSSIGRRILTAVTVLFSSDADTKKLDAAVEMLEKESENIGQFIDLLQASPTIKRRRIRYVQSGRFGSSPTYLASSDQLQLKPVTSLDGELPGHQIATPPPNGGNKLHQEETRLVTSPIRWLLEEEELVAWLLQEETQLVIRLRQALNEIGMAVTIVETLDVSGLEWLPQWADFLREARQQGSAVLGAIGGGGGTKGSKETTGYDLEDEDELDSFVQTLESLAGDLGVIRELALLCPFRIS